MIALYARVSTLNQATGLEAQIRSLEAYRAAGSVIESRLYTDEVSGRTGRRAGLEALMADARSGLVTQVVVYSLSRFSRSVKHLLSALDELDRLGVGFVSLTEQLNTGTPTGRAIITIISAIAQLESDLVKERVRNGLANARAKGIKLGAPSKHGSKLDVVRLLSSQNMSHRQIASVVGASPATICRLLKRTDSKVGA